VFEKLDFLSVKNASLGCQRLSFWCKEFLDICASVAVHPQRTLECPQGRPSWQWVAQHEKTCSVDLKCYETALSFSLVDDFCASAPLADLEVQILQYSTLHTGSSNCTGSYPSRDEGILGSGGIAPRILNLGLGDASSDFSPVCIGWDAGWVPVQVDTSRENTSAVAGNRTRVAQSVAKFTASESYDDVVLEV
jgi:hypothetical protein